MSGRDFTRGYTDDEYFSGGPCPSCRLAINKETGRLKWCMGGNDTWRLRVKLMIFIPVLLLPITIVFIALSRSQAIGRSFNHRTYLVYSGPKIEDENGEIFIATTPSSVDWTNVAEEDDRTFLSDIKTSYVPADAQIPIQSSERRKREVTGEHQQPRRNLRISRKSSRFDAPTEIARPHLHESRKEGKQVAGAGDKAGNPNNEVDNFLLDRYFEIDEEYENEEKEANDYPEADEPTGFSVKNGDESDSMDDRFDYEEDYGHGELSQNESDEDERFMSVEVEDSKEDESGEGEKGDTEDASVDSLHSYGDGIPDYHAFWKDAGTVKNIRETQAKIMLKYMDKTVDPCQDFYQYACGNWAKLNPIPKDKAGYDTFEMLRESLDSVLRELLEEPIAADAALNGEDATIKAKRLFQSCMNYEILEQRMERPLLQLLDELGGWPILKPGWDPEKFDWLLLVAQLRLYNNDILISEWVGPDIKNSDQYIIQFDQTSLGLPTRDYFLQPSNSRYLEAYRKYLIKIATLLGASLQNAKIHANELIDFETRLAKITSTPDERRNVSELYRKMTVGELRILIPQINWRRYLSIVLARPVDSSEPVVVFAIQYIQDLVNLLSQTPPRTVSNYLLWRFVRHRVNNLDDRFQEAKQRFYYILFGREQAPSRWKTCVAQVNSNMGMAVGSMFVRKYFDENSKNDTLSMTRDIQWSFKELLDGTQWIDNETKQMASEKADAMLLRIGYPDFILQPQLLDERYKDVVIQPDRYFENTLNILQHLTRVEQDRLGSPVNKSLWNTAPAVVNAYYSRNKNQIMFPAGILQPPFYHRHFPRSLNYGGIGVVIGHEITHGFDDKGRLFDKDGNLHRWWKNEAIDGFHERAQCLIDQYSRYVVNEVGMQIDGVNTQGENIADNGGIKQAFRAYEKWLRANGDADETLPGMNTTTGKQLFFLNFAQVWCGSMRPEAMKNKLKTAVHSPGKYRVIGTLSNSKDFAEVFDCPAGSPMNPFDKCSVW